MTKLGVKKLSKNNIKSFFVIVVCTICSFGIFIIPNLELSAKVVGNEVVAVEGPCEEGIDELIAGKRLGFLGCWGARTACKIKCK